MATPSRPEFSPRRSRVDVPGLRAIGETCEPYRPPDAPGDRISLLVDEMLSRYIDWREEAASANDAYVRWLSARPIEAQRQLAAYLAALEQEECAAAAYAAALSAAARWL